MRSLPVSRAWFEGQLVEYVTTDVSDAAMAARLGVNYVPRLEDSLPAPGARPGQDRSVAERVYMFAGREQINVFPSTPNPTGATNADHAYSPLWVIVFVSWRDAARSRLLVSEEQILAAEERGELQLEKTRIVVNCPVVRSIDGRFLKGVN